MPPKKAELTNPIQGALKARDAIAVLQIFAAADVSKHVHHSILPQVVYLCCDFNKDARKAENNGDDASLEVLVAWAGLIVLETFSADTPKIASSSASSAAVSADGDQEAPSSSSSFLTRFAIPAPHPSFRPLPLTEGVASLYLRLLAKVLALTSSSAPSSSPSLAIGCSGNDLAAAYRILILGLSSTQQEQAHRVAYAAEMKKFTVRRRFFHPVLQVAAQLGLPRLCVEVMDSVISANGGDEHAGMHRKLMSSASAVVGEDEDGKADAQADGAAAAATAAAAGDDDDDADVCCERGDDDEDDEDNSGENAATLQETDAKHAGKIRPRGADEEAAQPVVPDNAARLKRNAERIALKNKIAEERGSKKTMKHDKKTPQHNQQHDPCEMWEVDFALMITALANFVRRRSSKGSNNDNSGGGAAFDPRAYLDRVITTVAVSHPLVGDTFRTALFDLSDALSAAAAASDDSGNDSVASLCRAFRLSGDATVAIPRHQHGLMETAPCCCSCCKVAVGGPSLELSCEQAEELACAIKDKLIISRLRHKYRFVDQEEKLQDALARWDAFERLCRAELPPDSVIVDGANIGFYGLNSWYARAKRAVMERRGVPEDQWDWDELDSAARRSRGKGTDISPSFSQIDLGIRQLAEQLAALTPTQREQQQILHAPPPKRRQFVVVLHARHLRDRAVSENADNAEILAKWKSSCEATDASHNNGNGNNAVKVVAVASPVEVNDDWCWMFMSLVFAARSYPSALQQQQLLSAPAGATTSATPTALPVIVMTNDLMRDHIAGLLPGKTEAGWKFLRYRWLHQVKCTFFFSNHGSGGGNDGEELKKVPLTRFPPRFHTWPVRAFAPSSSSLLEQAGGDDAILWHIPFTRATLLQGTAKTGIKPKTDDGEAAEETTTTAATAAKSSSSAFGEVSLPEQLLDMLAFAGNEAKGRLLCLRF